MLEWNQLQYNKCNESDREHQLNILGTRWVLTVKGTSEIIVIRHRIVSSFLIEIHNCFTMWCQKQSTPCFLYISWEKWFFCVSESESSSAYSASWRFLLNMPLKNWQSDGSGAMSAEPRYADDQMTNRQKNTTIPHCQCEKCTSAYIGIHRNFFSELQNFVFLLFCSIASLSVACTSAL